MFWGGLGFENRLCRRPRKVERVGDIDECVSHACRHTFDQVQFSIEWIIRLHDFSPEKLTMYPDRTHLRTNEVKVRFDQVTMQAVDALARLTRKQRAVLIRDLVMDTLKRRVEASRNEDCIGSR